MNGSQLRPLIALRWRMVRGRRSRLGFGVLAASIPVLVAVAVAVGFSAPEQGDFDVVLLAPTAYLSVALLAVLAPLVAGGGNELFPEDQLTAFPVTARTRYIASLALTPLNLAWTTQLLGLVGLTAYISPQRELAGLAIVTCMTYVGLVTVTGQALGWLVVGIRHRRSGRRLTWAVAGVLVLLLLTAAVTGNITAVLESAPTTYVVIGALNGASGRWGQWAVTTLVLLVLTGMAWRAGRTASAWALRQPGGAAQGFDARMVARRTQHGDVRGELLATDRASVWRSPSLRRGLIVLGLLPGLVAAAAGLSWPSLVLLPGLVAAGAGLLFGVNVFCLDGSGSIWLASQPHSPGAMFWTKAQVIAEVCLIAVVLTVLAGSVRSGSAPTSGEAVALLCCAVVATSRVLAICMELSVMRPHRADLRGPRDTPAPPGVMAAYSVRLAVSTTLLAVFFSALAEVATWHWSVLFAIPLVLLSTRRLVRSAGRWQEEMTRSRVVTVVASG